MKSPHKDLPRSTISLSAYIKNGFRTKRSTSSFIIIAALLNAILYNWPLLSFSINNLDGLTLNSLHTIFTVFVVIYLETALALYLLFLISRRLGKTLCVILALANSLAVYFVVTYNVILGTSMMGNVFNTKFSEASPFLSGKMFIYFVVLGMIPAWLIIRTSVLKTSRLRLFLHLILTIVISVTWVWFSGSTWLWVDKHAKQLGGITMPWSYVGNSIRFQIQKDEENVEQTPLPNATFRSNKKTVVVLVIGESARAEDFSLYGYKRPTNPLLSNSDVITLKNATSCATYTTASVKCILSYTNTSNLFGKNFEPLPSYLQRQGIDVFWRSHNWGEPPLKIASYINAKDLEKNCEGDECDYDGVLLSHLAEQIKASKKQKIFVVLHQSGSHGPTYYLKYPKAFEVFKPVCRSVELSNCTHQELVNAYDNTILYNDHFLDQLRTILKGLNTASAFLYVSDHGESLGEDGVYLHGTPYSIAPKQQYTIPFLVWMSQDFIKQQHISVNKLKARAKTTQDNVFHSVMGAFDMRSPIYNKDLDIFAKAKTP
ncbi:phosphoethanolamine--lipid A transferase EptA [Marinomonas spartinae]|uniref:phosphoethanolamine--lipid A transferase EptA n=1 Tax=Marinomonas spartinae TaxID=1792290 RepID=UPI0018F25C72|nr:phosphoethanolamine--lipid A transferase EptA [Marinomonas spartinae]MBJ7554826.1 phosphoethanolamine--lipid A transferase EptA [Marinomonas spartinae]